MKLTQLEKEVISHRLSQPDAMAEVLSDETGISFDEALAIVDERAGEIIHKLESDIWMDEFELAMVRDVSMNQTMLWLAEDCIGQDDGEGKVMTRQRIQSIRRAHESIEDKLGELS